MAGERTEPVTPRRREQARERGQVAKSQEINVAIGLFVGFMALRLLGPGIVSGLGELAIDNFSRLDRNLLTNEVVFGLVTQWLQYILSAIVPLGVALMIAGIASGAIQTGFLFSPKAATPDVKKVNPWAGVKRLFSSRSVVELAKAIFKVGLVIFLAWRLFDGRQDQILTMSQLPPLAAGELLFSFVLDIGVQTAVVFFVIAGIDYLYQRWMHEKQLRMSKQEVKESIKQTEGDPQMRARFRQQARSYAKGRQLRSVPDATVVITNPTHLAIALEFEPGESEAPRVVAKGERLLAQRIKRIAEENRVPVIENRPLAWALHRGAEVGDFVPPHLYKAVAEVLAFVFSVDAAQRDGQFRERLTRAGAAAGA